MPELSAPERQAVDCWHWCEGWAPERWPLYGALHRVADWGVLAELMRTIRDRHRHHDEQQRKTPR